jgi:hypothetical protein
MGREENMEMERSRRQFEQDKKFGKSTNNGTDPGYNERMKKNRATLSGRGSVPVRETSSMFEPNHFLTDGNKHKPAKAPSSSIRVIQTPSGEYTHSGNVPDGLKGKKYKTAEEAMAAKKGYE